MTTDWDKPVEDLEGHKVYVCEVDANGAALVTYFLHKGEGSPSWKTSWFSKNDYRLRNAPEVIDFVSIDIGYSLSQGGSIFIWENREIIHREDLVTLLKRAYPEGIER